MIVRRLQGIEHLAADVKYQAVFRGGPWNGMRIAGPVEFPREYRIHVNENENPCGVYRHAEGDMEGRVVVYRYTEDVAKEIQ